MATISRFLKITGLFRRILSLLQGSFPKKTSSFKEPTNRSRCIAIQGLKKPRKLRANENHYNNLRAERFLLCPPTRNDKCYGVATISRLLKIIGVVCRISPIL